MLRLQLQNRIAWVDTGTAFVWTTNESGANDQASRWCWLQGHVNLSHGDWVGTKLLRIYDADLGKFLEKLMSYW